MRAQLIEQVRHCRHHCGGVYISAGEFGSVFKKSLGQRVGLLRECHADSWAERCLLGPPGKRVGRAAAGWIKARGGVPALEFAHDQLAIAIDVGADLQHRRFTVASCQRRQVGFWHNHGDLYRSPCQTLETKTNPNFLRIGRDLVVGQDDIGHRDGLVSGWCESPRSVALGEDRKESGGSTIIFSDLTASGQRTAGNLRGALKRQGSKAVSLLECGTEMAVA